VPDGAGTFSKSLRQPCQFKSDGSNEFLKTTELNAADAVLKDQMDNLVPQFKSANAAFVTDYQNARIIADAGGGGKTPASPTPPNP
jgi:hypothetical protein